MSLGTRSVSAEEIVAFAKSYDPQYFHLDAQAAKDSLFGGLVASGWHVCAMMMRMMVDHMQEHRVASLGSPGIESCRWVLPVRPGDRISGEREVLETWPSKSKPMGFVRQRIEVHNQDRQLVSYWVGLGMFQRRPEEQA